MWLTIVRVGRRGKLSPAFARSQVDACAASTVGGVAGLVQSPIAAWHRQISAEKGICEEYTIRISANAPLRPELLPGLAMQALGLPRPTSMSRFPLRLTPRPFDASMHSALAAWSPGLHEAESIFIHASMRSCG